MPLFEDEKPLQVRLNRLGAVLGEITTPVAEDAPTEEGPAQSGALGQIYEGPLDLLLDLIKKNEMNIYDIPMAEITRQYLDVLEELKHMNLNLAGDFLVMAATLIYIKSKMILPANEEVFDDEDDGADPRDELVRRLLEYQAFREVARELGFMEEERTNVFRRQIQEYVSPDLSSPDEPVDGFSNNMFDLMQAFYKVLKSASKEEFHEVFEEVVSIDYRMKELKTMLFESKKVAFFDLFKGRTGKMEIVVTFLALLELVKQKYVQLMQENDFGDIMIQKNSHSSDEADDQGGETNG